MSELKSIDIESRFEELENCIMSEYVRDELSRLKNDCVALISASPWIRFEDRKPDDGQRIVAKERVNIPYCIYFYSGHKIEFYYTHWMPIPDID